MIDLKKQFNNTAELYRIELCKMFEFRYGDTYWIGDEVGGTLDIGCGRLTLTFDDVRYVVDNKLKLDELDDWYDYNSSVYFVKEHLYNINLKNWHMGCPHVDATRWDSELMGLAIEH